MDLQERINLKKANRDELYCLEPPFPYTNFLIETSNACNHACIFCAHQKMKRKIGKIDTKFLYDVLQQAYDLGTREVGFYATGEPFLVQELPDYIKHAKDIGYEYVYLTSNGSLATPEKIRDVIDAGLDSIKFSINAPERKMYEFIHGRDDFDIVVGHLKYLNEYRRLTGRKYKIFVTGILTRFTEKMKDDYAQVFGDLADEIVFKYVYNQGGYMPEIDTLLKCRSDKETYRRCNLPFDAICVTCEGYLSVENADFENMLIVADLNKVSLKEGWYGGKMKDIRQMFIDDKLTNTVCDGCVHHEYRPARAVSPEYATDNPDIFSDRLVRERIEKHRDLLHEVCGYE
ncbi:MAG: radical SAM protein [Alphaproteobacteria bacterium]|nr:radical SAM protein [Alphaproteobacteria bacterium]